MLIRKWEILTSLDLDKNIIYQGGQLAGKTTFYKNHCNMKKMQSIWELQQQVMQIEQDAMNKTVYDSEGPALIHFAKVFNLLIKAAEIHGIDENVLLQTAANLQNNDSLSKDNQATQPA